jgi:hypothetical protein
MISLEDLTVCGLPGTCLSHHVDPDRDIFQYCTHLTSAEQDHKKNILGDFCSLSEGLSLSFL